VTFECDATQQRATASGRLRFTLQEAGRPLFDMVPRAARVAVNGLSLPPERPRLVLPPDDTTPLRMLDARCPRSSSCRGTTLLDSREGACGSACS
jgi:hypothetical protein